MKPAEVQVGPEIVVDMQGWIADDLPETLTGQAALVYPDGPTRLLDPAAR